MTFLRYTGETKGIYYYDINLLILEKHKTLINKKTIYPKFV
jgi:hypothetical protein